jgi:hypothetical protein
MKHLRLTRLLTALLAGGCLLLNSPVAHGQESDPHFRQYLQERLRTNSIPSVPSLSSYSPSAQRNGPCDILFNGDFEAQNSVPYRVNNLHGGNGVTSAYEVPIPSDLTGWESPTQATPDYCATNATDPMARPATAAYGPFTPFGTGNVGAVGVGSILGSNETSEYVSRTQSLAPGRYYTQFKVNLSQNATAATCGVTSGFGLQVTATLPTAPAGNVRGFVSQVPANKRVYNSTPIGNNNINAWTDIRGQFDVFDGDNTITIGLFDRSSANMFWLTGRDTNVQRTYMFVDNVELFKIPIAGPDISLVSCSGNPATATLGVGCDIPGAAYQWRQQSGGQSVPVANGNSMSLSISITATTVYYLDVFLPDGSVYTTSATVTVTPATAPAAPDVFYVWEAHNTWESMAFYQIANYNPLLTYTVTTLTRGISAFVDYSATPNVSPTIRIKTSGLRPEGDFTVTATGPCAFSTTSDPVTVYFVYDPPITPLIALSPNPATEEVLLQLTTEGRPSDKATSQGGGISSVQVYDAFGKLRLEQSGESATTVRLRVAALPPGLYTVQTRYSNNQLHRQKLEITR